MSVSIIEFMIRDVVTISPFSSVMKAENLMFEYNIGGLPVLENNKLMGIITSQDIRRSHPNRLVIDAMTEKPYFITEEATIFDALNILQKYKVERLPIISKEKRLIGIITKGDIYKQIGKYYDALTGLASSEFIISKAIGLSQKSGRDLVVLFFDLNNFGKLNKKYGHTVGDSILKDVSILLKSIIGEGNLCRYGGDEFAAVVFSHVDDAKLLAEKVNKAMSRFVFLDHIPVSLCIGIAGRCQKQVDVDRDISLEYVKSLINLASLASTKAKKLGLGYVIDDTFNN